MLCGRLSQLWKCRASPFSPSLLRSCLPPFDLSPFVSSLCVSPLCLSLFYRYGNSDGTKCKCEAGYGGASCEQCANEYYQAGTRCKPKETCGSCKHGQCDYTVGKCICPPNFKGAACDECAHPELVAPACLPSGEA